MSPDGQDRAALDRLAPRDEAAPPFEGWLAESAAWAERALCACIEAESVDWPARLGEAIRYAALGGGKRIRPVLVRLASDAHGGSDAAAAPAAVAVELIHAYSLVHDDLPCMDDDDLRRGRPTVHRAFDEATAVLAGDALQSLAFAHLASRGGPRAAEAVALLAAAAGPAGMAGGQALDLAAEGAPAGAASARDIHRLKTGRLFAASAELGALAAGAGRVERRACAEFGATLGLLFQAVDDVLDVTGDRRTLGKSVGKDERASKGTIVAGLGLAGARAWADELAAAARAQAERAGLDSRGRAGALVERLRARSA